MSAASECGVRKVIFTSSREVYGQAASLPVPESAPLSPKNAYGASKAAGEVYCRLFAESGMDVEVLRLANVYGPGDSKRVIPLFLANALNGLPLVIHGENKILDFRMDGRRGGCTCERAFYASRRANDQHRERRRHIASGFGATDTPPYAVVVGDSVGRRTGDGSRSVCGRYRLGGKPLGLPPFPLHCAPSGGRRGFHALSAYPCVRHCAEVLFRESAGQKFTPASTLPSPGRLTAHEAHPDAHSG